MMTYGSLLYFNREPWPLDGIKFETLKERNAKRNPEDLEIDFGMDILSIILCILCGILHILCTIPVFPLPSLSQRFQAFSPQDNFSLTETVCFFFSFFFLCTFFQKLVLNDKIKVWVCDKWKTQKAVMRVSWLKLTC